ncbi:hypothetical protein LDENG_00037350 [Lucifuga dentata]|nr:hypothetical protein LDENG_00037350 [Lucifuga dentata]
MDSTRPLKVSCGIWHQDVNSRFFKSCKFGGGASMDQTCFSSTSHRCSIGLTLGEFGGQVELFVMFLKPFLNNFCSVAGHVILLKEAAAIREYRCHEGVDLVSNNVLVGGTCQSNIHMNAAPKVSQQNIAQIITLLPSACLLPIVHPGAISSPDKRYTHTAIHMMSRKT